MTQPYDGPKKRSIDKTPRIQSEAGSTGAMVFGLVVGVCAAAAVIMLTIKLGVMLFT